LRQNHIQSNITAPDSVGAFTIQTMLLENWERELNVGKERSLGLSEIGFAGPGIFQFEVMGFLEKRTLAYEGNRRGVFV
jgi:hypothetical protein